MTLNDYQMLVNYYKYRNFMTLICAVCDMKDALEDIDIKQIMLSLTILEMMVQRLGKAYGIYETICEEAESRNEMDIQEIKDRYSASREKWLYGD